jgi:hypothetical protein
MTADHQGAQGISRAQIRLHPEGPRETLTCRSRGRFTAALEPSFKTAAFDRSATSPRV